MNSHTDYRHRFKDRRHHPHWVLETRKAQRKKSPGQGTSPPHSSAWPTCIPSSFGCWVALAPQCLPMPPPPQSTSLQAFHPKAPKHVYQNQLRVCADLFLIAGAWFTLAPPTPILIPLFGETLTSGAWMGAKTAFSPGLGQGPAPPSCNFTEGPGKVSSRAKVTWHLPSDTGLLLPFFWDHHAVRFLLLRRGPHKGLRSEVR